MCRRQQRSGAGIKSIIKTMHVNRTVIKKKCEQGGELMAGIEFSKLLDSMYRQKIHQGLNVRVLPIDYNTLLMEELEKIESFSPRYGEELRCLSKCIRRYLWHNNTERLHRLLFELNYVIGILADIMSPEIYWNQNTIIEYVEHLYRKRYFIGVTDDVVYDRMIDAIQTAGAKSIIDEKWSSVLESDDGSRTFIELFDDIFTSVIERYDAEFIRSLNDTDVMYRMVQETSCNENRFIPWPNKTQNRWNPPEKTYLYLSYGKNDTDYNANLKLGQYICLLECKLTGETDTCFCKFRPVNSGRILDLSYNDVELYTIRQDLENQANSHVRSMVEILSEDDSLIRHRNNQVYVRRRIERTIAMHPMDRALIEKNSVMQILKLICSCIYKKVDEDDEAAKEKAYKSFQILAEYLEGKGITGIIYPCTRTNRIKGKNVVLFNIHDAEPISGSIMQYHYTGTV